MYVNVNVTPAYAIHELHLLTNATRLLFLETIHSKLSVNVPEHSHRILLLDMVAKEASAITINEAFERHLISAGRKDALNKSGDTVVGVWDGRLLSMFKYSSEGKRPSPDDVLAIETYAKRPRPAEYDWGILRALTMVPTENEPVSCSAEGAHPYVTVLDQDHVVDALFIAPTVTALFPDTKEFVKLIWGSEP